MSRLSPSRKSGRSLADSCGHAPLPDNTIVLAYLFRTTSSCRLSAVWSDENACLVCCCSAAMMKSMRASYNQAILPTTAGAFNCTAFVLPALSRPSACKATVLWSQKAPTTLNLRKPTHPLMLSMGRHLNESFRLTEPLATLKCQWLSCPL